MVIRRDLAAQGEYTKNCVLETKAEKTSIRGFAELAKAANLPTASPFGHMPKMAAKWSPCKIKAAPPATHRAESSPQTMLPQFVTSNPVT